MISMTPVVDVIILIFRMLFIEIKLWSSEIKMSLNDLKRNWNTYVKAIPY